MRALLAKPPHLGAILLLLAAVAEFSSLRALSGPENRLMDALVRMQEVPGKLPWPRGGCAKL